jgi:hypothetical protein
MARAQRVHLRRIDVGWYDRPGRQHQHRTERLRGWLEHAKSDADAAALQRPIGVGRGHVVDLHDVAPMLN